VAFRVRHDCVFVRIETAATGWALSPEVLQSLDSSAWIHLEADERGLRGVAAADETWAERLGAWVGDLTELADLDLRENVCLIATTDSLPQLISRLPQGQSRIHAVFGGSSEWLVVVDANAASHFV